jgi:hypothetical protein
MGRKMWISGCPGGGSLEVKDNNYLNTLIRAPKREHEHTPRALIGYRLAQIIRMIGARQHSSGLPRVLTGKVAPADTQNSDSHET